MGTTAEKLTYLSETKASIKNAIAAKGVNVPDGATFRQYANLISGISTGLSDADLARANATPEDVTAGKTFYAGNRTLKTGTAEKGLTYSNILMSTLTFGESTTLNISSKTFILIGVPWTYADYEPEYEGAHPVIIYYNKGSKVMQHTSYPRLDISVSSTSSGFDLTLTNNSLSSLYFNNNSSYPGSYYGMLFEG